MKPHIKQLLRKSCVGLALTLLASAPVTAADITKDNNNTDLDLTGSWLGGVVPTNIDVAIFGSALTSASSAAVGASLSNYYAAIRVTSPANDFTINSSGAGSTVYLFTNGTALDLSAATKNLTINADVSPQASQIWNIQTGRTLTLGGDLPMPSMATALRKRGDGTLTLTAAKVATNGVLNLDAGTTLLTGGNNRLPTSLELRIGSSNAAAPAVLDLGGGSHTINRMLYPTLHTDTTNRIQARVTNGVLIVEGGLGNNVFYAGNNSVADFSGVNVITVNTNALNTGTPLRNVTVQPFSAGGNMTNVLVLARTNIIRIGGLTVGASGTSQGTDNLGAIRAGTTNFISATSVSIGGFNARGAMSFQAGLTSPSLVIRGTNGNDRIPSLTIGDTSSGVRPGSGALDGTGGTLDIFASFLRIGRQGANGGPSEASSLTLANGTIDALDAFLAVKTNTGTMTVAGTLNQLGGTVTISNLVMGLNTNTPGATPVLQAALNLNAGTLRAASISGGFGANGAGTVRSINWTNGTIRNYDGVTDLAITNDATVANGVAVLAPGTGSRFLTADASRTITVNARFSQVSSNATPVVVNGAGSISLGGSADNDWLGLNISNGIVLLNKASSASIHALGADSTLNAGTLRLTGTGGDQIVNTRLVTVNGGTFDLNGLTETIGGLAGTGGIVTDSSLASTLTLSVASGSNFVTASTLNGTFSLVKGGLGKQSLNGTDSRSSANNTVNQGTLEIGTGGATGNLIGDATVNAGGTLGFNRSGSVNYAGNISGAGDVAQNGPGTLVLSGSVTHTGNTFVNSGTLQLPVSGTTMGGTTITVAGPATFDVAPGAGGFFLGVGQTLKGAGKVTGDYIIGTGATLSGTLTNTGSVTGADVTSTNAPGGLLTAGTLRINGSYNNGPATLVFDLANNTAVGGGTNDLLVVGGNLDLSQPCSLVIRQLGGGLASGTYVLATYGTFSGSTLNVTLPTSPRYTFGLSAVSGQLRLTVTGTPANLVWRGDGGINPWDDGVTTDWFNTGSSLADKFFAGDNVTFDNTGATNPIVDIQVSVFPASLTVNSASNYTFNGAGSIEGAQPLTKSGSGTLAIGTVNGFLGAVNANGGTISVSALAPAGTASPLGAGSALNFNGGALQYTGPALAAGAFTRDITLNAGGGTIDQQCSSGGIFLFITNRITGSGALTKVGAQQLILGDPTFGTGSNDYAGITFVNAGFLQIRHPNALGTTAGKTVVTAPGDLAAQGFTAPIPENIDLAGGSLSPGAGAACEYGGTITLVSNSPVGGSIVISGPIVGPGQLEKTGGGALTLLGTNTWSGGTLISAGTVVLGTNSSSGSLPVPPSGAAITNNGNIQFNRADTNSLIANITGTGGLTQGQYLNGVPIQGTTILGGTNDFAGNVGIFTGTLRITSDSALGSSLTGITVINGQTNTGILALSGNLTSPEPLLVGQRGWTNGGAPSQPPHIVNVSGNNTLAGRIELSGGGNYWAVASDAGNLTLSIVSNSAGGFNRPLYLQGAGNGTINGSLMDGTNWLQIVKYGSGTWTLAGDVNVPRGVDVREGTLIVNTNVGLGNPTPGPGASVISGGTLRLGSGGVLNGPLTLNGGTLAGTGTLAAGVTNNSGTIAPGATPGAIGTLTFNDQLYLVPGSTLSIDVNKSLSPSNDVVSGSSLLITGGSVVVNNAGPALAVGDKFVLLSTPAFGGELLTVTSPGVVWTNELNLDGSISVLALAPTVNTNSTNISVVVSGANLNLSWPASHIGWKLQVQTNSRAIGLKTNWFDVVGSDTTNLVTFPINKAEPTLFFRMKLP